MRLIYLKIHGIFDDFMYQEGSYPNIRILKIGEGQQMQKSTSG